MASRLAFGVLQSSRSTPAVRFPRFSVTRLTANALPQNERVSNLCKAFALRQSLSRVAFAMRTCMPLTVRSTRRQSMACHVSGTREEADTLVSECTFMLSSCMIEEDGTRSRGQGFTVLRFKWDAGATEVATGIRIGVVPVISRCRPAGSGHDFRRRTCFSPVSAPLRRGLRFLQLLLPTTASDRLAALLPSENSKGAVSGLPSSI